MYRMEKKETDQLSFKFFSESYQKLFPFKSVAFFCRHPVYLECSIQKSVLWILLYNINVNLTG